MCYLLEKRAASVSCRRLLACGALLLIVYLLLRVAIYLELRTEAFVGRLTLLQLYLLVLVVLRGDLNLRAWDGDRLLIDVANVANVANTQIANFQCLATLDLETGNIPALATFLHFRISALSLMAVSSSSQAPTPQLPRSRATLQPLPATSHTNP